MEKRFHCTVCGKCCFGLLPLTLEDALRHAALFPLALAWACVHKGAKAFALTARLGTSIKLRNRQQVAVLITPAAYIPPSFPCPTLMPDGRCGIHQDKPSRCRSMPFYPYREEQDQADLLVPRKGWACDTSAAAPVVYREWKIVDRLDFDQERRDLLQQAPTMQAYAEHIMKYMPWLLDKLAMLAAKPTGGHIITSLSSFLAATRRTDRCALAERQLPIFEDFAARTADHPDLAEYHRNYLAWAKEMRYLAERKTDSTT